MVAAKIIKLQFSESIKRAAPVKSFRFFPGQPLEFKPGQFAKILFDRNNISNKDLNKYLSFSSSPGKKYFEFTKKLSQSRFSGKLNSLVKGDEIFIQAPLGSCIFRDEYKKISFLIGGIGITPVISILSYIAEKGLRTDIILFYSNRAENKIAFREELDSWEKDRLNLKLVYTVTDSRPADKSFLQGYIDEKLVMEKAKDFKERVFFIFGPPGMASSMAKLCDNLGCDSDKVKKESFIGY